MEIKSIENTRDCLNSYNLSHDKILEYTNYDNIIKIYKTICCIIGEVRFYFVSKHDDRASWIFILSLSYRLDESRLER